MAERSITLFKLRFFLSQQYVSKRSFFNSLENFKRRSAGR
jgi:hypothetical protein